MRFSENERFVRVARIGKPHGIRGEVTVELFTDSPEARFAEGNKLLLKSSGATKKFSELTAQKSRWNKKILLLKFTEFSDRNTAESLRNSELYASPESSVDDENAWYADELVGFTVHVNVADTPSIGQVTDLITASHQDLLQVQLENGREVLVPFVEEIVPEIDDERGTVVINPPPGLLELNQD